MKGLLDNELLSGAHEVVVGLRPHRVIRPVSNVDEAVGAATLLCQVWGGAGAPLFSTASGHVPDYLLRAALEGEVDGFIGEPPLAPGSMPYIEQAMGAWDYPAAVIAAHRPRDEHLPIEVVDLDPADPWRLPYLGVLGTIPDELDENLADMAGVDRFAYDRVFPFQRVAVNGSLDDLLTRLQSRSVNTPRRMSSFYLASGQDPNNGFYGGHTGLPDRAKAAQAAGPNIVVVMSPESVDDFALLWNLRAAWGDRRAMPIGVPRQYLDAKALDRIHAPGVTTFFGWSGGRLYLTSASLDREQLEKIAAQTYAAEVADPSDLLRLGPAPSRPHRSVQAWSEGSARIVLLTDEDRNVLAETRHRPPSLVAAVNVPARPAPPIGSLRSEIFAGLIGGAVPLEAGSKLGRNDAVEVRWPSGWTLLDGAAEDRGLDVRASQPGIAAMALLRALGDVGEAYFLSDPAIIEMLYTLAELSGMSWWKQRWARVQEAWDAEKRPTSDFEEFAAKHGRDLPVIAAPHDGRTLTFSAIQKCVGSRDATKKWITWALRRRLLVKGVALSCENCRAPFWVPEGELAPPHVCPGCGRVVDQPFGPDTLTFSYRLGEVVRRCLEVDALGHVLALRWLTELFGDHGLIGAHPGVEFIRDGAIVAEIDVVLLLRDGSLIPVEVKRRATGFDEAANAQLDAISDLLVAPFDVVSVMESVPGDHKVRTLMREVPARPRFLLTGEHLSMGRVMWPMGANPFDVPTAEAGTGSNHHVAWMRAVASMDEQPDDVFASTVSSWKEERTQGA